MDLWAAHLTARSAVRLSVTRFLHNWRMFQFSFSILQSSFEVLGFIFESTYVLLMYIPGYFWEYLVELPKQINSLNLHQFMLLAQLKNVSVFRFQYCNPLSKFWDSIFKNVTMIRSVVLCNLIFGISRLNDFPHFIHNNFLFCYFLLLTYL
jgi:hypothetical protein